MRSVSSATWTRVLPVSCVVLAELGDDLALALRGQRAHVRRRTASRRQAAARARAAAIRRVPRRRARICSTSASTLSKRRSPRSRSQELEAQLLRRRGRRRSRAGTPRQLAAAGLERRAHADVDRGRAQSPPSARRGRRRRRGRARRSRVGDEVGGREARACARACRRAPPRRRRRTARRAAASACCTRPPATRPRMWLEETISPSTSSSGTTRVSKRSSAREQSRRRPGARWPKRKFSPTETCVAPSALDEHVVDEVLGAARGEVAVERDRRRAPRRPSDAISSALRSSVVSSLGGVPGRDDRQRMRIERDDGVGAADDLAVAEVHAVERADGHAPRARLDVGQGYVTFTPRKPTLGFSGAVRRLGDARPARRRSTQQHRRRRRPRRRRDGLAVAAGARPSLVQRDRGRKRQRLGERDQARLADRRRATVGTARSPCAAAPRSRRRRGRRSSERT